MLIIRTCGALYADGPRSEQAPLTASRIPEQTIAAHPQGAIRQLLEAATRVAVPTPPGFKVVMSFESHGTEKLTKHGGQDPPTLITACPRIFLIREEQGYVVGTNRSLGSVPFKEWFPAGESVEEYLPTEKNLPELLRSFVMTAVRENAAPYASEVDEMYKQAAHASGLLQALRHIAQAEQAADNSPPVRLQGDTLTPASPGCHDA